MSQKLNTAITIAGIDIGKNSFLARRTVSACWIVAVLAARQQVGLPRGTRES